MSGITARPEARVHYRRAKSHRDQWPNASRSPEGRHACVALEKRCEWMKAWMEDIQLHHRKGWFDSEGATLRVAFYRG